MKYLGHWGVVLPKGLDFQYFSRRPPELTWNLAGQD